MKECSVFLKKKLQGLVDLDVSHLPGNLPMWEGEKKLLHTSIFRSSNKEALK